MLFKALSAAVYGIDAYLVEVEVDVSAGLGNFLTVGLPDMAVRESK
jgi:magnesium chelatase family protein